MKKITRRLILLPYGYRLKSSAKRRKPLTKIKRTPVKASQSQTETPNTRSAATLTATSTRLAHFDKNCDPYKYFLNNLPKYCTELPPAVFCHARSTNKHSIDKNTTDKHTTDDEKTQRPPPVLQPHLRQLTGIASCLLAKAHRSHLINQ